MSKTISKVNSEICTVLKYAIISLVFLVPFADLVMGPSLYFPYITGKGFFARALIIIIAALYVSLVTRDRSYLPKKTPIVWSSTIFILILLAATINAVDPWRSFWSNQERMEGFVTLFEMFILFIVTFSVFSHDFIKRLKEKNLVNSAPSDFGVWKWFLNTTLGISIPMGIYAILTQKDSADRISGSLGNSSYLGGYALVSFFLAVYLLINMLRNSGIFNHRIITVIKGCRNHLSEISLSLLYIAIGVFNLFIMYRSGTRGSFAGLLAGLCITAIILAIAEKRIRIFRWVGIISLILVASTVIFLGTNKNASFIKNNVQLNRFAQLITLDINKVLGDQGHSRTMLWKMSYEGVKEKPLLGWGQDNFPHVFAKYYDPAMYAQEQWFDRTHNVFFDWLIAAGFFGLAAYLLLFASAMYVLWRKLDDNWSVTERAVLTGMLIAYFVHNFFVFDNLSSYIFFFTILAFISTRIKTKIHGENKPLIDRDYIIIIDILFVALCSYAMWISVLSPYISSGKLIYAMQEKQRYYDADKKIQTSMVDPKIRFTLIKSVIEANDLTKSESLERLMDISNSIINQTISTNPDFAREVNAYVEKKYAEQFKSIPTDPRPYFFYSIYKQKNQDYVAALDAIDMAIKLSPTKQSFLYSRGQLLEILGRKDEAIEAFLKAYKLDESNNDALKYYSAFMVKAKKYKDLDLFLDDKAKKDPTFKKETIWQDPFVIQALMDIKDFDKAIEIAKNKVKNNPEDIQSLVSLSTVYLKQGDKESAIRELRKIKDIEPMYATEVDKYIQDIKDGKDPSAQQPSESN